MKRIRNRVGNPVEHLEPRTMLAGVPELVRDINVEIAQPAVGDLIPVGDASYFLQDDQLWVTDGTKEGTRLVRAVALASEQSLEFPESKISHYHVAGDQLFFVMENKHMIDSHFWRHAQHIDELWVTDGTSEGTVRLKTVPGKIQDFVQVENKLFFTNTNPVEVRTGFLSIYEQRSAIWTTNGLLEGTLEVVPQSENVSGLVAHNGKLKFATDDSVWTLDDNNLSSKLLNLPNVESLTDVADTLFITTADSGNRQLWVSDGSEEGTVLVAENVDSEGVTLVGESVLFTTDDALHIANVQASGEIAVVETSARPSKELAGEYVQLDDTIYFVASDRKSGAELHIVDPFSGETSIFLDLLEGRRGSNPRNLVVDASQLFFVTTSEGGRSQIWESDGTVDNTKLRGELDSVKDLAFVGETLLVVGASDNGPRLWTLSTDGLAPLLSSSTNTQGITAPPFCDADGGYLSCHTPLSIVGVYGDEAYFYANDGDSTSLWKSDGTEHGTRIVGDIALRQRHHYDEGRASDSFRVGTTVYFTQESNDSVGPTSVMASDLESGQTKTLASANRSAHILGSINGRGIFATRGQTPQVWSSDGTEEGTFTIAEVDVSNLRPVANFAEEFYFVASDAAHGEELWKTDGTADGTTLVSDLAPGARGSRPIELIAFRDRLLFLADDGVHGYELWSIRDREFSPPQVEDVVEFPPDLSNVAVGTFQSLSAGKPLRQFRPLFSDGHSLYFQVHQVWKTDGSVAGTTLVVSDARIDSEFPLDPISMATANHDFFMGDINDIWAHDGEDFYQVVDSDGDPAYAREFVAAVDSHAFFRSTDGFWVTDGTPQGTQQIAAIDVYRGETAVIDDLIYFAINDHDERTTDFWVSDGSRAGTFIVDTLAADGWVNFVSAINGSLVFGLVADTGKDTWFYRPARIGDLDRDNDVDFADFLAFSSNFGAEQASRDQGDINGDGSIDFADFLLMAKYFGSQESGQEVIDAVVDDFV